ncbi:hypothetical protein WK76_24815 [Burkholderia ubonensis]|nr:hypothetical protein WK76_24815 [Burkholderia ubonensis]
MSILVSDPSIEHEVANHDICSARYPIERIEVLWKDDKAVLGSDFEECSEERDCVSSRAIIFCIGKFRVLPALREDLVSVDQSAALRNKIRTDNAGLISASG